MRNITILEDQVYKVDIHLAESLMHVTWKQHIEGDLLQEKFLQLLDIIRRFNPRNWFGDARATHYITIQDAKWLLLNFIPSLIESSVLKYARLESTNSLMVLDSMSLQDKINALPQNKAGSFEFRFFTDEDQAHQWLAI
ncbi:hypothetical protein ACSX1A_18395 [Pontibacter sp. MBLB2868]|uniref:hypothetical protein n=1 Tax=Pontibacter sp. MBLB2868 TaxID=3451555 RepID=UPI003F753CBD